MKFDLVSALTENGFSSEIRPYITEENTVLLMSKTYERTADLAWYGLSKVTLTVAARFSHDGSVVHVSYIKNGNSPFKQKTHLADKRAYNAILNTVEYAGYKF